MYKKPQGVESNLFQIKIWMLQKWWVVGHEKNPFFKLQRLRDDVSYLDKNQDGVVDYQ